ncbi:MAG: hypothetical protein Sapg2KO_48770 [Saprospiraceae bacterium]
MNNFIALRHINRYLKYKELPQFIGENLLLNIKSAEGIVTQIQTLIQDNLGLEVKGIASGNFINGLAKAGILDVSFIINEDIDYLSLEGIEVLKTNGWIERQNRTGPMEKEFTFLPDLAQEISSSQHFLKIFARAEVSGGSWMRNKTYLVKQMIRKEGFQPKPEDEVLLFKIEDICQTNCLDIWRWKHFYM